MSPSMLSHRRRRHLYTDAPVVYGKIRGLSSPSVHSQFSRSNQKVKRMSINNSKR